jgi:hypothetical protein
MVNKGNTEMATPSHIVEIHLPETHGGGMKTQFIYGGLENAKSFIRSKLSLSEDVALKHKHIYHVLVYGGHPHEFVYSAAG